MASNCGKALGCGSNEPKHAEYKALKATNRKHNSGVIGPVDRKLLEYVCFAAMVEKFGYSYDPKDATQRASVYAGKCEKMDGSWVSWNAMINEKDYFYLRRQHERVFAEKWALHSAESQECEFLDEEPADDRRPQRDA